MFGNGMKDLQTPVSHDVSPWRCAADIQSHSAMLPAGDMKNGLNLPSTLGPALVSMVAAFIDCHQGLTDAT
jgi:hypothetical protein